MSKQQYKLIYFNARGRGELSRLILHCAGVPFEDFRFEMKEWPAIKPSEYILKPTSILRSSIFKIFFNGHFVFLSCCCCRLCIDMPFGQVPVLEVDGSKLLAQSHSIARYLARQHGLAGRDDWEMALADSYVACVQDFHTGAHDYYLLSD